MKSFDIKTKIYFGDNAMDRVREIPYSRILIITDKFFSGSSMLRIVTQPLSETNKEFRIFNDVGSRSSRGKDRKRRQSRARL